MAMLGTQKAGIPGIPMYDANNLLKKEQKMEPTQTKKSLSYYARCLHRDIGFLLIGLTIVYALSGILLMYRMTGFLQTETTVTQDIGKGLAADQLGKALKLRHFQPEKQSGDIIAFSDGSYNQATGVATYIQRQFPAILEKFIQVHKLSSNNALHVLSLVYATLLLFLALSSLVMYKPGTRSFRRGLGLTVLGVGASVVLLLLC